MTRGQMRTRLRARIQEVVADQFQDTDLNELLNLALQFMQTAIMAVDPAAFIFTYQTDIIADEPFYPKPAGFSYEIALRLLDPTSGKYRKPLERTDYNRTFEDMQNDGSQSGADGSQVEYAHYGVQFYLSPTPTISVPAGLQCECQTALVMAADTDVPDINLNLHMGIVYQAQILAMGETGEGSKEAADALALLVNRIPSWYQRSAATPISLQPDIDYVNKGY